MEKETDAAERDKLKAENDILKKDLSMTEGYGKQTLDEFKRLQEERKDAICERINVEEENIKLRCEKFDIQMVAELNMLKVADLLRIMDDKDKAILEMTDMILCLKDKEQEVDRLKNANILLRAELEGVCSIWKELIDSNKADKQALERIVKPLRQDGRACIKEYLADHNPLGLTEIAIFESVQAICDYLAEEWLYKNPEALASVKKGLEESGLAKSKGSFAEYAYDNSAVKCSKCNKLLTTNDMEAQHFIGESLRAVCKECYEGQRKKPIILGYHDVEEFYREEETSLEDKVREILNKHSEQHGYDQAVVIYRNFYKDSEDWTEELVSDIVALVEEK